MNECFSKMNNMLYIYTYYIMEIDGGGGGGGVNPSLSLDPGTSALSGLTGRAESPIAVGNS